LVTVAAIKNTRVYHIAERLAAGYLANPERLKLLISRSTKKAQLNVSSRFNVVKDSLFTFLRLLKAYSKGEYRDIPWKSLSLIVACVIYFLAPIDLIPDILGALGLFDDAALVSWTFKHLTEDLQKFRAWEENRSQQEQNTQDDQIARR